MPDVVWFSSLAIVWLLLLFGGFLLLGTLRQLALLRWRLEQLAATTPSRIGRNGLRPGTKAPNFTLKETAGTEVSLEDFRGQKVLLVFIQPGCGPCTDIMAPLNALHKKGTMHVLAINHGDAEATRQWARHTNAAFPVLVQEKWNISRQYETLVTPFAFLIDEQGTVKGQGIIKDGRHIDFLLSAVERVEAGESFIAEIN